MWEYAFVVPHVGNEFSFYHEGVEKKRAGITALLAEVGRDGWEAVSCEFGQGLNFRILFKRPLR